MTDDPWTVERADEGFILRYDGLRFPMQARSDEADARAYLERVRRRYGGDSARVLCATDGENGGPSRGGPWAYSYPSLDGEGRTEGVVHTSRLKDAKQVLRAQLERKRLPNGIEWSIAE